MWTSADQADQPFYRDQLAPGSLVVTQRSYNVGNQRQVFAGHIGILTSLPEDNPYLIHANPASGKVEEQPLPNYRSILGVLGINWAAL